SGKIVFRGDLTNPEFEVVAEYTGTHTPPNGTAEQVKIQLTLSGTKASPQLTMRIFTGSEGGTFEERNGNQADIQEDVLYFLASGSFKSELGQNEQLAVINRASSVLTSE